MLSLMRVRTYFDVTSSEFILIFTSTSLFTFSETLSTSAVIIYSISARREEWHLLDICIFIEVRTGFVVGCSPFGFPWLVCFQAPC